MSLAWSGVLELDPGTGRRPCSRPTTALRRSSHCLDVSDILLELDKYLKTDENVEIGFETSVFCIKNKKMQDNALLFKATTGEQRTESESDKFYFQIEHV